jgi:nucleoside-diphosphate-sugar epimerase
VIPGFFMDYWGMPHVKTQLSPMTIAVDMANCEAAIPGDGNDIIAMTYSYDMARFIARLLESEKWEEFSVVVGDETTYNQLVKIGERVRGEFDPFRSQMFHLGNNCETLADIDRPQIQGAI